MQITSSNLKTHSDNENKKKNSQTLTPKKRKTNTYQNLRRILPSIRQMKFYLEKASPSFAFEWILPKKILRRYIVFLINSETHSLCQLKFAYKPALCFGEKHEDCFCPRLFNPSYLHTLDLANYKSQESSKLTISMLCSLRSI